MKCSCVKIKDEIIDVYKNPITDRGKVSKKGRLDLIKTEDGQYETVSISNLPENTYHKDSVLNLVFENGEIIKEYTLDEVRNNENLLFKPAKDRDSLHK